MEFSQDWKSLFPIYSTVTSPLLLSGPNAKSILGPLLFNPIHNSLTSLFTSSPPSLISPPPQLSLSRFLTTSSSVPLSTSTTIASDIGSLPHNHAASSFSHNRLCLLYCPLNNSVFAFFPTGINSNLVGFSVLSVCNGCLSIKVDETGNSIHTADTRNSHPILKIVVNSVADLGLHDENMAFAVNEPVAVGYLLAFTMYSVHWFKVGLKALGSDSERPDLAYLGNKVFKSCPVVDACWSPHLAEESVVLLESGELFLFDMERCLENTGFNASSFKGTRLRVTWDDSASSHICEWLAVDFSWHPRILVVARTDAVFVIDLRDDECTVSYLLKIDMLGRYSSVENGRFHAFCKAGSDGFYFTLASNNILVLCDVRKPLMPVLHWDHGLHEPCSIDVFTLSELRSHSQDDTYKWASECGFGIMLGSIWSGEFSLFCYGPPLPASKGSFASKIPKFCQPLYAWELPSGISLSGRDCWCGSCLVKEEFMKNTLPEWIDWQQKKELVLGFGVLNKNLSALLSGTDEYGGFTLVRLMSSGKLESQKYCASWDLVKKSEEAHRKSSLCFEDNFLYSMADEKYKFPKRFKYLKLDYLRGYLNGNLAEVLDTNMDNPSKGTRDNKPFDLDSHEILCEKLEACGFSQLRSSHPAVISSDVSLPTSIHEVAFRRIWMNLPIELLQLAFSCYSKIREVLVDQNKVSFEFLAVPDLPQLPPFYLRKASCRSNKLSKKMQPSDDLVGPVVPLPLLLMLREFHSGRLSSEEAAVFSVEMEVGLHCKEAMQDAMKMAISDSCSEMFDNHAVNLDDDKEEILADSLGPKPFVLYRPVAFKSPSMKDMMDNPVLINDDRFTTLICKVPENEFLDSQKEIIGEEVFDQLSPMVLKFDDSDINFGPKELKAYNLLRKHYSRWQKDFD